MQTFSDPVARAALADPRCTCWRLQIPLEAIGVLRFLLEAYEGLAQLFSERGCEEALLVVPKSRADEAALLLDALRHELGVRRIDS